MLEYQSVYLLASAIGLSSAYFDGPFERYRNEYELWSTSMSPLAASKDRLIELENTRRKYIEQNKTAKIALPFIRSTMFAIAIASFILAIAVASIFENTTNNFIAILLCSIQILMIAIFQLFIFYKNRSVSEEIKKFEKLLLA